MSNLGCVGLCGCAYICRCCTNILWFWYLLTILQPDLWCKKPTSLLDSKRTCCPKTVPLRANSDIVALKHGRSRYMSHKSTKQDLAFCWPNIFWFWIMAYFQSESTVWANFQVEKWRGVMVSPLLLPPKKQVTLPTKQGNSPKANVVLLVGVKVDRRRFWMILWEDSTIVSGRITYHHSSFEVR